MRVGARGGCFAAWAARDVVFTQHGRTIVWAFGAGGRGGISGILGGRFHQLFLGNEFRFDGFFGELIEDQEEWFAI